MMHISAFAKLCGTTVKTLRHYDRIGILLPDYVSPRNGYRYYRRSTADRYFQIRAMQEAGLTLREIGESLSDRQGVIDLLAERAKALQMQAAHCKALQEACEDALLQQKRYTVTVQEELVQISCAETGETIQVNAEEAYRAVVLRLVENGLSEERLLSLNLMMFGNILPDAMSVQPVLFITPTAIRSTWRQRSGQKWPKKPKCFCCTFPVLRMCR